MGGEGLAPAPGRLLQFFFRAVDDRSFDEAADCFAPDGVWHRHGSTLHGRHEVVAALRTKPGDVTERHMVSTTHVEPTAPGAWRGISYVQIVRGRTGAAPVPAESVVVGDFRYECRSEDGTLLLTRLESAPTFRLPA
jgi:hypothetical protein